MHRIDVDTRAKHGLYAASDGCATSRGPVYDIRPEETPVAKNVFYVECSSAFWLDVAARLQASHRWMPAYWTGCESLRDRVQQRFPGVCFHHNVDAVKSRPVAEHASRQLPPIDEALLNDLVRCERTALRMMDRFIFEDSLSYSERIRLFHRHVRYWLGMLQEYEPRAVFLPNSPHLVYDYVLYELCNRAGIPTVHFNESAVNGLIYPVLRFENSSSELSDVYRQLAADSQQPDLSPRTIEYLNRFKGDYADAAPPWALPKQPIHAEDRKHARERAAGSAEHRTAAGSSTSDPPGQDAVPNGLRLRIHLRPAWRRLQSRLRPIRGNSDRGERVGAGGALRWFVRMPRRLAGRVYRPVRSLMNALFILARFVGTVRRSGLRDQTELRHTLRAFIELIRSLNGKCGAIDAGILADAVTCTRTFYEQIIESYGIVPRLREPVPQGYHALNGEPPESSDYSRQEYWIYRMLAAKKKVNLRKYYESLAQPVDLRQPYIYLPLHFQPEKSTCPEGGVFENQYLVVDLLAKCAPPDWDVVVREHPAQFELAFAGEMARTKQLYDDIREIPKVRFAPLESCPFALMDGAQAVATVTGTSAWEAVLRGKPALVFGHAWYRGCEGIFHTPTVEHCRQALRTIAKGYKPDARKVRLFLQALEQIAFYGFTDDGWAEWSGVSSEENVASFVRAFELKVSQRRAA